MIKPFPRKNNSVRAFSLVEVALSLGIVAFSCLTMLGLIPAGLNSFHQAMGNMAESQIVQGLTENMTLSSFANVSTQGSSGNSSSYLNQTTYYDDQGVATNSASSGYVYKATVVASDLNSSPVLTNSNANLTANYGSSAVVQIVSVNQPGVTNYFPIVIANQGY